MNALDYTRLKSTAESSFFDTCKIGTITADTWGGADTNADAATYGSAVACGFAYAPKGEADNGSAAADFDAVLRLPVGTTVASKDRIQMTHRCNVALDAAEYYEVVGKPALGQSALVLEIKLLTGNSTL